MLKFKQSLKKASIELAIGLAAITIIMFLALFFWFAQNASFTHLDYLRASAFVISFVLPILYTFFGFLEIYKASKTAVQSFRQAFRLSFFVQLLAGLLSASFIFAFFNTTGQWAETELELALIDVFDANQQDVSKEQQEQWQQTKELITTQGTNLFSFGNYLQFLSVLVFFYLLISAILAAFLKNRRF